MAPASQSATLATVGVAGAAGALAATPTTAKPDEVPAPTVSAAVETTTPTAPAAEPKLFPIDVITGPEMAYLVDYANSGASEVAKKSCSGKTDEDAEKQTDKHAECLTKAREKFGADVLRFKKDAKGHVKLFIYRRSGSALAELFTANIELKEVSPNLVKVELKGGSGQRPIIKDRGTFDVKVPNSYSIELDDTIYGKLTYDAKVGLVGK